MEVRDTTKADAERVAALIDSVARERRYLAGTVGFPLDSTRAFIASVQDAGGVHLVAVALGEVIGWCDIVPHPFEGMQHVGRLGMGVQKDHRSRGVGRELLAVAVRKAFAGALDRIELEVFASNRSAVRLYEAFGFEYEGRKVAARRIDGVTDDILLYATRKTA
ncbi:MAG: N-acetyltransferase family protein [Limisphaerales bacterium]